ncbi:hypothetical protein EVC12_031 [Rhizobium phage RHph_I42]|nr:hypothetical protein EVC12_031 [Rhizobium phage RHph_I42]
MIFRRRKAKSKWELGLHDQHVGRMHRVRFIVPPARNDREDIARQYEALGYRQIKIPKDKIGRPFLSPENCCEAFGVPTNMTQLRYLLCIGTTWKEPPPSKHRSRRQLKKIRRKTAKPLYDSTPHTMRVSTTLVAKIAKLAGLKILDDATLSVAKSLQYGKR